MPSPGGWKLSWRSADHRYSCLRAGDVGICRWPCRGGPVDRSRSAAPRRRLTGKRPAEDQPRKNGVPKVGPSGKAAFPTAWQYAAVGPALI